MKQKTEYKRRKDFRKAARRKAYVLRKGRYLLLQKRSNTKEREIQAVVVIFYGRPPRGLILLILYYTILYYHKLQTKGPTKPIQ